VADSCPVLACSCTYRDPGGLLIHSTCSVCSGKLFVLPGIVFDFSRNYCSPWVGTVFVLVRNMHLRFLTKEYSIDSGGAGTYRGGLGQQITVMLTDEALGQESTVSMITDRTNYPPLGYYGGLPGARRVNLLNDQTELHSKKQLIIRSGDRITSLVPGGGGYGDPRLRDPQAVVEDVRAGFVSVDQAEQVYGVRVDTRSWTWETHPGDSRGKRVASGRTV